MAVAQLPPHVMLDRHLLHAERLMARGDPVRELEEMRKALDLKMDHDLELPEDFDSKYAEVAFSAGSLRVAMDSVNRFLETAVCAGSMAQGTGTIKRVWNYGKSTPEKFRIQCFRAPDRASREIRGEEGVVS